mmetsp:Transcript_10819/g.33170  ORF Transcript_10819/g.33170 Transcript_10819/m.33170 type:complete len:334 (-) Transcript_10819:100-1101(-)
MCNLDSCSPNLSTSPSSNSTWMLTSPTFMPAGSGRPNSPSSPSFTTLSIPNLVDPRALELSAEYTVNIISLKRPLMCFTTVSSQSAENPPPLPVFNTWVLSRCTSAKTGPGPLNFPPLIRIVSFPSSILAGRGVAVIRFPNGPVPEQCHGSPASMPCALLLPPPIPPPQPIHQAHGTRRGACVASMPPRHNYRPPGSALRWAQSMRGRRGRETVYRYRIPPGRASQIAERTPRLFNSSRLFSPNVPPFPLPPLFDAVGAVYNLHTATARRVSPRAGCCGLPSPALSCPPLPGRGTIAVCCAACAPGRRRCRRCRRLLEPHAARKRAVPIRPRA